MYRERMYLPITGLHLPRFHNAKQFTYKIIDTINLNNTKYKKYKNIQKEVVLISF